VRFSFEQFPGRPSLRPTKQTPPFPLHGSPSLPSSPYFTVSLLLCLGIVVRCNQFTAKWSGHIVPTVGKTDTIVLFDRVRWSIHAYARKHDVNSWNFASSELQYKSTSPVVEFHSWRFSQYRQYDKWRRLERRIHAVLLSVLLYRLLKPVRSCRTYVERKRVVLWHVRVYGELWRRWQ